MTRTPLEEGNLRGQVATEFLLYTGVFMLVAVAAFVVVSDMQSSEVPLAQNTVAKETGDSFASVLTLAVKGGNGFSYNYSFPRTIFGRPYSIDMRGLASPDKSMILEWGGEYGNFSYQYGLPPYQYDVSGACLDQDRLTSSSCANMITLSNNNGILTIMQVPG
ncbi:MAG: hypothetical protein V1827_04215 [Candidatus Micrarchaeota archaeon]